MLLLFKYEETIMIITTNNETYIIDENISLVSTYKDIKKYYELGYLNSKKTPITKKIIKYTVKDIKDKIVNVDRLLLEVTQNCNMRCRYCVHSDIYEHVRAHTDKKMSLDTAKKSVDYFFSLLLSKKRKKTFKCAISFFGGEPLIEKNIIFDLIKYIKEINRVKIDIDYLITTNGLLLKNNVIKELKKENIRVDISFDGEQYQHDMFRKKISGKGSWNDIIKNIKNIKSNHPEYYSNIRFQLTIHPNHDIVKIERYLYDNPDLFSNQNVILNSFRFEKIDNSKINLSALNESLKEQLYDIENNLDKEGWFYYKYNFQEIDKRLLRNPTRMYTNECIHFTGTCFPGERMIFVDTSGNIKLCEKSGEFFIGDIEKGISSKIMKNLMNSWNKEVSRIKCWECAGKFDCYWCVERGLDIGSGSLKINKNECKLDLDRLPSLYRRYFSYKEQRSKYSEKSVDSLLESI